MKTRLVALLALMLAATPALAAPPVAPAPASSQAPAAGRHVMEILSDGKIVASVEVDGVKIEYQCLKAAVKDGFCTLSGHVAISLVRPGQPPLHITAEEVRFQSGP